MYTQFLSYGARLFSLWRLSPRLRRAVWLAVTGFVIAGVLAITPPTHFPSKKILTVRPSATVTEVAEYLKDQGAINSTIFFRALIKMFNPKGGVLSGMYYFEEPTNLITVSYRIAHGKFGLTPRVFFVPEGSNIFQIAALASSTFPNFDTDTFLKLARSNEGYLFPDTYHMLPTVTPEELIALMRDNFDKKIITIDKEIRLFGRPLSDVIKMASYLEEEARLTQTRRMIAGILWKRLDSGMPLQIDSAFQYVGNGKTYQLTLDDLKLDSPYNTYLHKGLTPTPISNPGLDALTAAVTPISSRYFFFLTDKNGVMHYAVTHEEHVANKERYLR